MTKPLANIIADMEDDLRQVQRFIHVAWLALGGNDADTAPDEDQAASIKAALLHALVLAGHATEAWEQAFEASRPIRKVT